MRPHHQMAILEKRIDICRTQLDEIGTCNINHQNLIRVLRLRQRKLKDDGVGSKSLAMVIISDRLKKLKSSIEKAKRSLVRFRQMKIEAEKAKENLEWGFGRKELRQHAIVGP